MIHKTLMAVCVILTLTAAALWPVSHWWRPAWYDTIQTGPLAGYWCGCAVAGGDFVIQWDSPKPPTVAPMGVMTTSVDGTLTIDGKPAQAVSSVDDPVFSSATPSDGGNAPVSTVVPYYGTGNTLELAFWGWKLEYDRVTRVACIDTPLPMLAFLFAFLSLLLGAQGSLLRRRRRNRGLCVQCAYDLRGNASGICPECGTKVEQL